MDDFTVTTRRADGTTILDIVGELDLATTPTLRAHGLAALATAGCTKLVLDLAGLTFLDSTGLGCWVELRKQAVEHGQQLELQSVPVGALRTITIGGLASLFGLDRGAETRPAPNGAVQPRTAPSVAEA